MDQIKDVRYFILLHFIKHFFLELKEEFSKSVFKFNEI